MLMIMVCIPCKEINHQLVSVHVVPTSILKAAKRALATLVQCVVSVENQKPYERADLN